MVLPEYLSSIKVEKTSPPVSNSFKDLPFHDLLPAVFEKFCCELLIKRAEIEQRDEVVQIMPIGVQGQKQFGSDIFVIDQSSGDKIYSLYEVKRLKKYAKSDFEKSVKRFLENHDNWNFKISSFFIFVSHNISAEQISLWQIDAKKLSNLNVNYTILTPSSYKIWLTDMPELVYAYFGDAWVEILYGKIGLWHLQKYGIYKFEESKSWINYEKEELFIGDNDLRYINDHVKIHCFMPSLARREISCFFELRNGRFSHVMITLDNRDLLSRYFYGINSPLKAGARKFITFHYNDSNKVILDIGNCRIIVSEEEAECACKAFDVIWNDYKNRVQKIEEILKTKYFFPMDGFGKQIPLMRIKPELWHTIKKFTDCHDCTDGNGPWNIFQYTLQSIKIFTIKDDERLASGDHCTFLGASYDPSGRNLYSVRDEVVVLWQYPFSFHLDEPKKISPRYYWDAKTAHDWFRDELIPHVLAWSKKTTRLTFKNIKEKLLTKNSTYAPQNYIKSNFDSKIGAPISWNQENSLLEFVADLQYFYSSLPEMIYLDSEAHRNVFKALSMVLKSSSLKEFTYIKGNLNYLRAENKRELLEAVHKQSISQEQHCDNPFKIDCILRCMLVCLKNECNLDKIEILSFVEYLNPLVSVANNQKMLLRQKNVD